MLKKSQLLRCSGGSSATTMLPAKRFAARNLGCGTLLTTQNAGRLANSGTPHDRPYSHFCFDALACILAGV
jgi:hypothetical protein